MIKALLCIGLFMLGALFGVFLAALIIAAGRDE